MQSTVPTNSSPEDEIEHLEELLQENLKLAEDTNRVLRSMRRWARLSFWLKVILWIIVLGVPTILLYTYAAPLLKYIPGTTATTTTTSTVFGLPSPSAVEGQMESLFHPKS